MSGKSRKRRTLKRESSALDFKERYNSRTNVWLFRLLIVLVSAAPLVVVLSKGMSLPWVLGTSIYFVLLTMTCHIAQQWEKAVILRLGRFNRVEGPGLFFTIPFFESASMRVDQRIRVTPFSAEEALTEDLVPTNIDAVLFWMVVNPERAWCEVSNYPEAVSWSAQTALRDAIGRINLVDISKRRSQIDRELKELLNEKTADWGISILSVEIHNILIPAELQDAMSREAQALQEKEARLILAEIEAQIAELMHDASATYKEDDIAFKLRMASMVNETIKESKSGMVVLPSNYSEGFNPEGIEKLLGRE